jgi:hypothetical protein
MSLVNCEANIGSNFKINSSETYKLEDLDISLVYTGNGSLFEDKEKTKRFIKELAGTNLKNDLKSILVDFRYYPQNDFQELLNEYEMKVSSEININMSEIPFAVSNI